MNISSCLKGILADKALVSPSSKGMMILREKNVMKVEVFGVPADITVINMNRIGSLSGLEKGKWKRHCDYLIVIEDDGVDHAVFIELKRTLGEEKSMQWISCAGLFRSWSTFAGYVNFILQTILSNRKYRCDMS